jgi:hypothetical protein
MGLGSRIRDPGSGKNLLRIPDPGSEILDPEKTYSGSRIRVQGYEHLIPDPDPQHCDKVSFFRRCGIFYYIGLQNSTGTVSIA